MRIRFHSQKTDRIKEVDVYKNGLYPFFSCDDFFSAKIDELEMNIEKKQEWLQELLLQRFLKNQSFKDLNAILLTARLDLIAF